MSRRWKIALALAVVGLAGFLVWAFLSPATPALSIRFVGYTTNDASTPMVTLPPRNGFIFAVFAVTNHSSRALAMATDSKKQATAGLPYQPTVWTDFTNNAPGWPAGFPFLHSEEGGLLGMRVLTTDQLIQVEVLGIRYIDWSTRWGRFRARLPWNKRPISVTATSEPR